jgi:hypothetical protein
MNLIQIQEHLKDLPTQAIMAYANGQNPEVPPYVALGEMNRRKNMEQRAAQAPSASVKEQLESELSQQVALPGIGQGMNMRINPAGMPQPMPAAQPQMAPKMQPMQVQPAARPMPPQQMSQPGSIPAGAPGMAAGGLAELPVRKDIFNYAPGGIVAFADEDNEQLVLPPGTPLDASETGTYSEPQAAGIDKLPIALANKIMAKRLSGDMGIPEVPNPEEIRKRYIAEHPEQAKLLNSLPGEALIKLSEEMDKQNEAQRNQFKEAEGPRGLVALSNALINAGEATRGQKGGRNQLGAAFGGFGKSFNASTAESLERASRQQALERAQTVEKMKLQADVENLQRAYAEGNVNKIAEYEKLVRARQEKIATMQGSTAQNVVNDYRNQQRDAETAAHHRKLEQFQQQQAAAAAERAKYERENRPTGEEKLLGKIQSNVTSDQAYKTLAKKLQDAEVGSEEYYKILDAMRDIAITYYPKDAKGNYKVAPPPKVTRPEEAPKPAEEQGFWDKFFNGPKPTSPAKPSAVTFDQLPK